MTEPLLRIENLTRVYHAGDIDVTALAGVSLTIERGEFVAIMGASGSGKSTLMSILGCLDRPTSGSYRFDGVDVASLSEPELAQLRSEQIGFVFQSFNLLPRTTAIENVALPLAYSASAPRSGSQRTARARVVLGSLGLADREWSTASQLSGGQQQRVAIARSLINEPKLLLADEPTGNLDTRTSHEIMEALTALNRDHGLTIVVVTHEADVAAYADRVVTMRDAVIVSDKSVERTEPATVAVRRSDVTTAVADASDSGPLRVRGFGALGSMILSAAVHAIGRNKLRAALTMLGVFIGVAALIAMVDLGQGANDAVHRQIENLGTDLVVVTPGAINRGGSRGGFGSASSLTVADAEAVQHDDPAAGQVAYTIRQGGQQVQYGGQNWSTTVQGVTDNYPAITNWTVAAGRDFSPADESDAALVAIIGDTVAGQLFAPGESPVGAMIEIKNVPVEVIGVFAAKGQSGFGQDQDDLIMIPFTTAERKVLGSAAPSQSQTPLHWPYPTPINPYNIHPRLTGLVNQIYVQAANEQQVQPAIDEITTTLGARHHIKPGDPVDFSARNLSQVADTAEGASQTFALLLAAVASISLLVGGIGIMNILLVSVTERTREIGLRMAIGARRLHVLLQFLGEAVLLSVTGGLVGVAAGAAASLLISSVAHWPSPISPLAVVGGFVFSAAIGIFFGYYPARKAAQLDPIEALRFE